MTQYLTSSIEKAFDIIQSSNHILLHLHPKPDLDSIGSALGMYHVLRSMGKQVVVVRGDSDLPASFAPLPGYHDIVLKSYLETDLSDFDLFIIVDAASKEMVSRKDEINFPIHLKTIAIDHHATNQMFADINIVDASYAATAELITHLLFGWNIKINQDAAACLYAGIYADTGGFRYQNTSIRSLQTATKLAEIYPQFQQLITQIETSNTRGKLYFDALALQSIETFFDDSVAIASVPYKELAKRGITREDSDKNIIANLLITVKEWKVGITLIEKEPKEVSVSLRSNFTDVSKIALLLKGGGHKAAAGATLKMSLKEAKEKVISLLDF